MKRGELWNLILEELQKGNYTLSLQEKRTEDDGVNVRIKLANRVLLFFNENGTVLLKADFSDMSDMPFRYQEIRHATEVCLNKKREESLARWKEQRDILNTKIAEVEKGNVEVLEVEPDKTSGLRKFLDRFN